MTIPRILVSVRSSNTKFQPDDCLMAIIDTGSCFNIINKDAVPNLESIKIDSKTSFRSVDGNVTSFLGTVSLDIRLLHPTTFQSIPETERDVFFHVSETLPVNIILGMPFLHNCTIHNGLQRMTLLTSKKKQIHVPFADKFSFFSHLLLLADAEKNIFNSTVQRNMQIRDQMAKDPDHIDKIFGKLQNVTINNNLPKAVKDEIKILLHRYKNIFQLRTDTGSLFKFGQHEPMQIYLSSRVFQPLPKYPIPESAYPELQQQLKDWLAADIIEPMEKHGEFLSPLLPVPKKSGETRFVLDTRSVNSITIPMRFHPPKIMDLVRRAAGYKYYTSMDIASFFLSFKLDKRSRPLVSFQSPTDGKVYQFKVTIFGLRNSMEHSLILMNDAINSIEGSNRFMISYVDDLVLFHNDLAEHLFDVERVFSKMAELNLKLKPSKVAIAENHCDVFGFRLDSRGFTVSPTKKSAILKIPPPRTKRELETILGKASYYRNLLPPNMGMGYFTHLFRDLRGNSPYKFTAKHQKAFEELKEAMFNFTMLQRLLPSDQHLIVRSDASHSHWAGSLAAVRQGKEIPIFHVSKAFAGPALRYAICRKELIGSLMTLYEFRTDLYGRKKVELHTDNPSTYFLLCHPEKVKVDSQVLQHMFYNVRYLRFTPVRVSGKTPDWDLIDRLSRSNKQIKICNQNVKELLTVEEDPVPEDLVCVADMRPVESNINGKLITAPLFDLKLLSAVKNDIQSHPDYKRNNVVPDHLKDVLLRALHQVGHLGPIRMAAILTSNQIAWKNRNIQIERIVRQCPSCSMRKPQTRPLSVQPNILDVLEPKYCVAIDVTTVGQPAIFNTLVMIDSFTHYLTARRIIGKLNYINVANTLLAMLAAYAPACQVVRLDNAAYYTKDFQNLLASLGIRCSFVSRHNSRGGGLVERAIKSVSGQFTYMLEQFPQLNSFRPIEIDLVLETISLHINMTHKVQGVTPYCLNYGRPVIPNDREYPNIVCNNLNLYEKRLTDRIKSLQQIVKMFDNKPQKETQSGLFKPGDLIRIRTTQKVGQNKLQRLYFSPQIFEISSVITNRRTYKLVNVRNTNDIRIVPDRHCRLVLKQEERKIIDEQKPKLDKAFEDYKQSLVKTTQNPIPPKRTKPLVPDKHGMTLRPRR